MIFFFLVKLLISFFLLLKLLIGFFFLKRKLTARSERVKCVAIHSSEPWVLCTLFDGTANIWNYETQTLVKSFDVSEGLPVRCGVFVERKQWVITGSDDCMVKVFNYNTTSKVKTIEAHSDYIRSIAVHPTQPFILTSSDDMSIKLWNWEKNWANIMIFDGHTHFVMKVVFNPKDPNTFASASFDHTVRVWGINSPRPYFTLIGHDGGVYAVDYLSDGDKPYLVSGADDKTACIWDYQTKTCVAVLQGHEHDVSAVAFVPDMPYVVTASEDGNVRVFNSSTFRLEKTLNYGLERPWCLAAVKGTNGVAVGYDAGTVFVKFGSDRPVATMDQSGKVIMARHSEIKATSVKGCATESTADGERLTTQVKDLGNSEIYPKRLQHSLNGRFVALCGGDGEYVIYTALAWRNKAFGKGEQVEWSDSSLAGTYAVRESSGKVVIFRDFKATQPVATGVQPLSISGGTLLGIRHAGGVELRTWDGRLVRQIDVEGAKRVYWSTLLNGNGGDMAVLSTATSFYVLRYDAAAVDRAYAAGAVAEDGVEDAVSVVAEVADKVRCGAWVGECFLYVSAATNKLCYCVGGHSVSVAHLPRKMHLLGYVPRDNRAYLIDRDLQIVSYRVNMSVINFQIATERGDAELAAQLKETIPEEEKEKVSLFLEGKGLFAEALDMATDADHRFELALRLKNLAEAHRIAAGEDEKGDQKHKWKLLGDLALSLGLYHLAEDCLKKAGDISSLLVLYTALGNEEGVRALRAAAKGDGANNIAFICSLVTGDASACVDLLLETDRAAEAALFARCYAPSRLAEAVARWKGDLAKVSKRAADALADPAGYPNLFGGAERVAEAELVEKYLAEKRKEFVSADEYVAYIAAYHERDVVAEAKAFFGTDVTGSTPDNAPNNTSDADADADASSQQTAPATADEQQETPEQHDQESPEKAESHSAPENEKGEREEPKEDAE